MERYFKPLKIARVESSSSQSRNETSESESMTKEDLMIEELLAPPKPSLARCLLSSSLLIS